MAALGHIMSGIGGTYGHVSESMRQEMTDLLQARWEKALAERAAMSSISRVPVLQELLAA